MNTLDLIQTFCAVNDVRGTLCAPFTVCAHTYATNGFIIIRVPAIPGVDELAADNRYAQTTPKLAWPTAGAQWQPLPELPQPDGNCPRCGGAGRLVECPKCEDGRDENHDWCEHCDGQGELPAGSGEGDGYECSNCRGTGKHWMPVAMFIATGYYHIPFLARIDDLPSPEIAVEPGPGDPTYGPLLWFRCPLPEGGMAHGILNPYKRN